MDDLREVIARAAINALIEGDGTAHFLEPQRWPNGEYRGEFDGHFDPTAIADAALAAIKQAGFVVVPVEPTARMCVAGADERDNGDGELHRRKYRAMVEASNG